MSEKEIIWILSDKNLDVRFTQNENILRIKDKRINKIWEQLPIGDDLKVNAVAQNSNTLTLRMEGLFEFSTTIELTDTSELLFTLTAESSVQFDKISFPPAFITPNKDHYLLQTDSQGLLLPVEDTFYPLEEHTIFNCAGGPGMAWIGVVDTALESGYMAIFETPFDTSVLPFREKGLITFSQVLLSSMGVFAYERKIRYVFFNEGGYVAQSKRYRDYIWTKNQVITLKENQKRFPAIEKMMGAVHMYLWDGAREVSFAKKMKDAGIEKALIFWDANHRPYPEKDYDNRLKELAYASGGYELFTDIHPDSYPGNAEITVIPFKRNVFPGLLEKITSRKRDGSKYSNEFGTYVCPKAVRPEIIKRVDRELNEYPHETYFLDVYQANGIYECHHPEHPLTREQYSREVIKNYQLLEDKYNTFLGGEFGADYVGSHGVYVHGMMTLQRTWFNSAADQEGTIYYKGDWNDNERPSIMLSDHIASEVYHQYSINEYLRVPLYELVYHDAIVTSWRWEDGNPQCPEIWWKKDLFNILYASAPLWIIDQERWKKHHVTFVESYQRVCTWLQQVCYDELVSHRFVSEDRKIQESVFSSGKRVVVNFGDLPYWFEGQLITSRGFLNL